MGFITGSRVYGTPREDSDLDLCVLVTKADFRKLLSRFTPEETTYIETSTDASFKIGSLNLIAFTDESKYDAWYKATQLCKLRGPVTREQAIAVIEAFEEGKEDAAFALLVEECHAGSDARPQNASHFKDERDVTNGEERDRPHSNQGT